MSSAINPAISAQTALGKFYLHPWDSQVLVDWAKSMVQKGWTEEELIALSEMEGASRDSILDQFDTVTIINDIQVSLDELEAISAYLNDLRERVLADKIDPMAAFAQVRPLAYDLEGIQLSGLSELDEDLNLLDSGEPPFHNKKLLAANRNVFIRTFFREMKILPPLPSPEGHTTEGYDTDFDKEFMRRLEALALAVVITLVVLYVFLVLAGFR